MAWVSLDVCNETKSVLTYPPSNLRVTIKAHDLNDDFSPPINYVDDTMFKVSYPLLYDLSLRDIRYG